MPLDLFRKKNNLNISPTPSAHFIFIDDDVQFIVATEVLPTCEEENENFSDALHATYSAKRLIFSHLIAFDSLYCLFSTLHLHKFNFRAVYNLILCQEINSA
jgi:hypothetical protein